MARKRVLVSAGCVLFVLSSCPGCLFLGPASVQGSRLAYNEAIVATNNQQLLSMIVGMRYGEPTGLLAVSSVTANMSVRGDAGSQFGLGPEQNYEGNLIPLSLGFAYEENPTITYTPVEGERFLRQMMGPLPLDLTALLLGAEGRSPEVATLLIRSINGIPNPDFLGDSAVAVDPRFARVVGLLVRLSRQGRVRWVEEPSRPPSYALVLAGGGEGFVAELAELHRLLGLPAPREPSGVVRLPLRIGVGAPEEPAIQLETRSLFDLFQVAAASVEVPEEDVAEGLVDELPPRGPAGAAIRIRRAASRPAGAMAAVRSHGAWFFIAGNDSSSKASFRMLQALLSVRIADAVKQHEQKPVLTVPVSR